MWPGKMAEGVRKKKDCWKTQRVLVDNSGVPDGSWTDGEVRAWLEWWRPEEELRTVCRCIGLEAKMQASKKKQHSWGTATAMRGALRDYYDSPVQGAPPLRLTTADLGLEARQPEPEPEQEPEAVADESGSQPVGPALFGVLPYECVVAVLDAGLQAVDLARLAIALPSLAPLLEDVAEARLLDHELRDKAPPRRPPPSLSIWNAAPVVAQRDFSGNEMPSGQWTGERMRTALHILWELEGLAAPLELLVNRGGSALTSSVDGAVVSRPKQQLSVAEAATATTSTSGTTAAAPQGASAVCTRSVMRAGVHFANFELLRMDEMDGGRGIRVGICRHGYLDLDEAAGAARLSARSPTAAKEAAAAAAAGVARVDAGAAAAPSVTRGTDEYLRYLEFTRSQRAEETVFSTEHAWGFEARTGSLVHRGKRAWWRTKGVAPGVDIARCVCGVARISSHLMCL